MARLESSESDSDLEVLQQLSDWESEHELEPRRSSRLSAAFSQNSSSQLNEEFERYNASRLDDTSIECRIPLNDESERPQDSNPATRRRPRRYKRVEHMKYLNDAEFSYRFRLNKSTVEVLLTEIMPYVQVTSRRNYGVAPLHQLLLTLRFYALGTMLVSVADFVGVSKSTACRIVQGISTAIAKLYDKHIVMQESTTVKFYGIAQFPRVFGAIDCTHVRIQSPNHLIGEEFKNRDGYYSINVQAVCDADLRLTNVVARWPGSVHESNIFENSVLKAQCDSRAFGNQWLLGDLAYPNRSYLLTPIINPASENEHRYNEAHYRTWNTIQRTFGEWKRRFPVIAVTLRLRLHNIQTVIIATAVLHNICRNNNLEEIPSEVELPQMDASTNTVKGPPVEVQDFGQREDLISNYFSTCLKHDV